jgi:hypothetical protein
MNWLASVRYGTADRSIHPWADYFQAQTGTMPTTPPIIVTAMRPRRSLRKRPHKAEQARRCPKAEYGLPDTIMSHDRDIEAAATISLRGNRVRCHASHMAMLRYQAQHMFWGFVCAMC